MTRPKDAREAVWVELIACGLDEGRAAQVPDRLDTYAAAVRAQAIDDVLNTLDPVVRAVEATEDAGARLALAWVIDRILEFKREEPQPAIRDRS